MSNPMLVVRLQDDLAPMVRSLIFHALMQVHGVETVTDLSAIDEVTLRTIMRAPLELPAPKQRRRKKAEAA